jgi:crossover junction endodeoxyribonuclease RuvC
VIEIHGKDLVYVASGCIKSNDKLMLPERIKTLFAGISEVIATYQPTQAAVEKVFVNVNPQSTLLLGQARGAAISALVHADLPVAEYTALQIKQAVVGQGKATKDQVQHMVIRLLNLPGAPTADAADALACAICHAHGGQGLGALSTTGYRVRGGRLIG